MSKKVTLYGREYEVEQKTDHNGRPVYLLEGKRGARYFTMRNSNPELMFVVREKLSGDPIVRNMWLTDKDGVLKEAGIGR